MEDLVSIIVPVYNSEMFIRDTINTVLEQTYKNWELILVDDCSRDNSINIIKEYISTRIKLIQLGENSGAAISRNLGIDNAKGRFIAFLDSDDLWVKDKLEKQIRFMKENNYYFTFTGYEFANANGIGNGKIVIIPKSLSYKQALKNTTIFTSTVILDKNNIPKKIMYMPNFKSEDTATWWKILRNSNIAYGLNKKLSYYRRTKNTLSSNKLTALKRVWKLYRDVEKLTVIKSVYNFAFYSFNAIKRRL
jgi:teichuronic acid biosynthesis glycosyltransferase TuaG